ncbi:hypothetical protein N7528_005756 [Penicillium herquei]|nr:hypothetical protein N7528_005756 [Penicillium herquei]
MSKSPFKFHTFALAVYGGKVFDLALATDFVMIAKKLMADGFHPTLLSGTDLRDITSMCGPFVFGRDDLRERVQIYDEEEARTPFYQLKTSGLKSHILDWVKNVSHQVSSGDRIIVVLIGHGDERTSGVTLYPQHGAQDCYPLFLPPNVRLLIVNEVCYSGAWTTITPNIGANRDVLVKSATTIGERSWAYRSGSGRNRCSLFGAAFVEELTTHPEGRISQHRSRIVDEMYHAGPDQETSTPLAIPSTRALLSHNISHFFLTPRIATAITSVASDQERYEALLKSRISARTFWQKFRRRIGAEREPAQAFAGDTVARDDTGADMKALVIESYLRDLGSLQSALDYCTLASACQCALEGRGPPDLKDQVISTIAWQTAQIQRGNRLLEHLAKRGLITDIVDVETAEQALKEHQEDIVLPMVKRLRGENDNIVCLMNPPTKGHVGVHFTDAESWLIDTLAYNWLMYPDSVDLDLVENEVFAFLA